MPDRKDAGVPAKTAFSKDVEGPQRILGDGIAGGPVAVHRFAGKVFKKGFGTPGFLPEGFRRLPVNQLVTIAVGGNLMACAINLPNQFRVVFRYPAQHKEGALTWCRSNRSRSLRVFCSTREGKVGHCSGFITPDSAAT